MPQSEEWVKLSQEDKSRATAYRAPQHACMISTPYKPHLAGDKTEMLKGQMTRPKLRGWEKGDAWLQAQVVLLLGPFSQSSYRELVISNYFLIMAWHSITEMLKALEGDNTSHSSLLSGSVSWKHAPQGFRRKDSRWGWASNILAPWCEAKSPLIGKDPDAGQDSKQEEKRVTEDEMVGRQHRLKTPGGSEAQGSLVCCGPCGRKETWRLNKNHKLRELRKVHPTLSLEEPKSPPAPQWQMKRIPFFLNEENWGRKGGHEERTCWVERKGARETVRGKLGSTDGSGLWIKPHFNLSHPRVFSSASQGIPFVLFFFN